MVSEILERYVHYYFNSYNLLAILFSTLPLIIGLWLILKKCGSKGWPALIPCYRSYMLGHCAGLEEDGKKLFVLDLCTYIFSGAYPLFPSLSKYGVIVSGLLFAIILMDLIFSIRIFFALVKRFNQPKRWLILWIISKGLVCLIFGLSRKIQPSWDEDDVDEKIETYFSGATADVTEEGLTVNLEDRCVRTLFSKKYLLRDVHLSIKPGSMVLLLGGSGAGKTTLLNAINGYEKANAKVYLNKEDVYKEYKRMQYEIGFVPQQDTIRYNDSVINTLYDAAALRLPVEFSVKDRRKRVEDVMEIFGLLPVKNSAVGKLSGGQRKRLSIAMEFISNPSLFILDEPDSGLDGVMARELMTQLRHIADQGKIVIVITHTPDRVIDLFDDVIVLAKDKDRTGRLAFYGSIPQAREFFGKEGMEEIVRSVNRKEEGGEGRADEFINKYAEVGYGE